MIKQTELAKALGLSKQAVSKLKGQGMPVTSIEAARTWRDENLNIAARKESRGPVSPPSNVAPRSGQVWPPLDQDDDEGMDEDFKAARTREKISEANQSEMREAKMRREMINVSVVERQLAVDYSTTRDALLQIPARMAPLLAAEADAAVIQTMLDVEIHATLGSLAGTVEQAKSAEGAFD